MGTTRIAILAQVADMFDDATWNIIGACLLIGAAVVVVRLVLKYRRFK